MNVKVAAPRPHRQLRENLDYGKEHQPRGWIFQKTVVFETFHTFRFVSLTELIFRIHTLL